MVRGIRRAGSGRRCNGAVRRAVFELEDVKFLGHVSTFLQGANGQLGIARIVFHQENIDLG